LKHTLFYPDFIAVSLTSKNVGIPNADRQKTSPSLGGLNMMKEKETIVEVMGLWRANTILV
jgi:hypothetical protein